MTQSTVKLPTSALLDAMAAKTKHVFISGASRGIGEAVARLLADKNVNLTLASRSYNKLLGVAMDVGLDKSHVVRMDLADDQSIDEAVVSAESKFGPIDVLICNAGIHEDTPIERERRGRALRRVIDVNLVGTYFLAQAASLHALGRTDHLRRLGVGACRRAEGQRLRHSKHALMGLVRAWRSNWRPEISA